MGPPAGPGVDHMGYGRTYCPAVSCNLQRVSQLPGPPHVVSLPKPLPPEILRYLYAVSHGPWSHSCLSEGGTHHVFPISLGPRTRLADGSALKGVIVCWQRPFKAGHFLQLQYTS